MKVNVQPDSQLRKQTLEKLNYCYMYLKRAEGFA